MFSLDEQGLPPETASFPIHLKRYVRVYVHHGTLTDSGVELIGATSTATADDLYPFSSPKRRPVWARRSDELALALFVPATSIVLPLDPEQKDDPIMAVQWTTLACGGFVLAVKIAHPLADIGSLTRFVRDWANTKRLWQAFLGQKHILVTTWARAVIYNIDFGLVSRIRYADCVVPCLNDCILIVDGPLKDTTLKNGPAMEWTYNGVDVTIPLLCEDMQRLLQDSLLLPHA
ncbi:unnamed protein product [Zymoseptoria tritici ST99CH_3D1]|nr:unnamed protein product [Zymoseptoria tritici ST99CH_3D1]